MRRPVAEVLVRATALGAAVGALVGLLALTVAVLVSGLADHSSEAVGTALTQLASVGYEVVFTGIGLAVGVVTGLASAGVWLALIVVGKVRPWIRRGRGGGSQRYPPLSTPHPC